MRHAYQVAAVRAAERALMDRLPDGTLMRRAAAGLASACAALLGRYPGYVYGARVLVLTGPVLAFLATRVFWSARAGRRLDEEQHGRETGQVVMSPHGGYTEIREPARQAVAPGTGPVTARTTHPEKRSVT